MDSEPMCRACLSESGDAVPIFSSAETSGVQMPLSEMMMACSSVQVVSGDGLPGLICLECLRSLLIAFEFKLKCEKTDGMLREYIENNLVPAMQSGAYSGKAITGDTNNLASIGNTNDVKHLVGSNELISTIPTIAINNANTIYGNTNPYIIPMVECDVVVKEDQTTIDNKVLQKCIASNTETSMMLKKLNVESQSNLTTTNTTVDMTAFSPRLISSDMLHPSPSQITIYSPEFRDLIRVSEEPSTLTIPKISESISTNSMGQCTVLTTNSYTVENSQCAIVQNNLTTTNNNNFLTPVQIPPNVSFAVKESNRKRTNQSQTKRKRSENEHSSNVDNVGNLHNINENNISEIVRTDCMVNEQPTVKKSKTYQHKKKNICATNEECVRSNVKSVNKDIKKRIDNKISHECDAVVEIDSEDSDECQINESTPKVGKEIFYNSNQGYIR